MKAEQESLLTQLSLYTPFFACRSHPFCVICLPKKPTCVAAPSPKASFGRRRVCGRTEQRRPPVSKRCETKVRMAWGSFLIAAAALKTPTRNGYNAQDGNLTFCIGGWHEGGAGVTADPALAAQEALLRQATEGGEADAGLYSCMIDYSICSDLFVNLYIYIYIYIYIRLSQLKRRYFAKRQKQARQMQFCICSWWITLYVFIYL